MDWDKYKSYGYDKCNSYYNPNYFWDIINDNTVTTTFWNKDNVVADVTDSYKELSSERIKE